MHRFKLQMHEAQAIACLEAALALWWGDFPADMTPGEWALLRGEVLRQSFLRTLLDFGGLHLADALCCCHVRPMRARVRQLSGSAYAS